uniref:Uncharacterized protein n=1 Tax=Anguilla anguilla TaxID=7936 RepID=A0A0E9S7X7_ANGAN
MKMKWTPPMIDIFFIAANRASHSCPKESGLVLGGGPLQEFAIGAWRGE